MANRLNPTNLPWFPFHTAAFLGSATVINMTVAERGIYITLLAMCWQHGSIIWDAKVLAKQTGIDYRVLARFIENYGNLTVKLQEPSSEVTGNLPGSYGEVVFGKLSIFSVTMGKRGSPKSTHDMRGDEKRVDNNVRTPEVVHPVPVSALAEDKTPSVPVRKNQLAYEPVVHTFAPVAKVSNLCSTGKDNTPQPPPAPVPAPSPAPPELGDIREWNSDAFGVPGERLQNCIVYQMDHAKNPWFRDSGITPASMGREKFVTKLNENTPPGWTPAAAVRVTAKPAKVLTQAQIETKEYNERIQRLKKEGKLK